MHTQLKWKLIAGLLIYAATSTAQPLQTDTAITAVKIVQRAIDNVGGDEKLKALKSGEFTSRIILSNNDTLYLTVIKKGFDKYYMSSLSFGYENTTTVYNHGKAVLIKHDTAQTLTDPLQLEELALRCYPSNDYGYKKLGYKLTRIEDKQFSYFDCYVVLAESPLGNKTLNYYDKKSGNCIMIMYASGGRTIIKAFTPYKGILYHRDLLLADEKHNMSSSTLIGININEDTDDNWFNLMPAGECRPPAIFKTGHFRYLYIDDADHNMTREGNKQIESNKEYNIEWLSNSDYLLYRLKYPNVPPINENIEFFKARITSWKGKRCYCQYITVADQAGACVLEKID